MPGPGKPFVKGESGNPSGRPRISFDIVEAAKAQSPDAIRVLASIMKDEAMPAASRVAAAEKILDRGYGKPSQPVEMKGQGLAEMNEAELDRRIALALAGEETASRGSAVTH